MSSSLAARDAVRGRVLAVLERVVGYPPDPAVDQLDDLDSLQVLELLVALEEEFDIDSDRVLAGGPDWWTSVSAIVDVTLRLTTSAPAEPGR